MMSSVAVAEDNIVVASPTMAFGLQAKVQQVLIKQIEWEVPVTLAEHVAQKEFDQMLIDTADIGCGKKNKVRGLTAGLAGN
jgi:predicted TPR repeat methyltransferase